MKLAVRGRRPAVFRAVVALVLPAVIAVAVVVVSSDDDPATIDLTLGRPLVATGPERIEAGEPWPIEVGQGPAGVDDADVDLALIGPLGVEQVPDLRIEDGVIVVPGDHTTRSGHLLAVVTHGDARGEVTVDVAPGRAVGGIVPLAGPRSMVADREHWTMVTSFPRDRFGNAVADGTPVVVHVRRPDGSLDEYAGAVEQMLAASRVTSITTAGRSTIRVDVDGTTGPEVEVLEVPGPPVAVELIDPGIPLRADGRMLVPITTDVLVDRYGNVLLDGTAVSVRIRGEAGASALSAVVVDGRAELIVEAPPRPGPLAVVVEIDGVRSQPLTLEFSLDVVDVPVSATVGGDGVDVVVGPVRTSLGGYVADGTPVEIVTAREVVETELRDGVVSVTVAALPGERLAVRLLGAETEVVVK